MKKDIKNAIIAVLVTVIAMPIVGEIHVFYVQKERRAIEKMEADFEEFNNAAVVAHTQKCISH